MTISSAPAAATTPPATEAAASTSPSTSTSTTATSRQPRPGRFRADFPDGTVVFLIGMHINQLWNVPRWLSVASAMGPMLRELATNPELGLLDAKTWISGRDVMVQQYWSDIDHLMRYATARDAAHLPAWQRYNRVVGHANAAVGVWHEAYIADPQSTHAVYVNMPPIGMARATSLRPAREMGAQPIRRRAEPTVAIPED
ncbi:MAG: DUF4188 domain-containing protein [Thermomicrobiales bacterium]